MKKITQTGFTVTDMIMYTLKFNKNGESCPVKFSYRNKFQRPSTSCFILILKLSFTEEILHNSDRLNWTVSRGIKFDNDFSHRLNDRQNFPFSCACSNFLLYKTKHVQKNFQQKNSHYIVTMSNDDEQSKVSRFKLSSINYISVM